MFYSRLVDRVRRYNLLVFYSLIYAVICLILAIFVSAPQIGLKNTNQSVYRLFGWFFFILVEGFSPFVLGVFLAFSNSINSPESAKKNYAFMVSGSKIGGMVSAGLATEFTRVGFVHNVDSEGTETLHLNWDALRGFEADGIPTSRYLLSRLRTHGFTTERTTSGVDLALSGETYVERSMLERISVIIGKEDCPPFNSQ